MSGRSSTKNDSAATMVHVAEAAGVSVATVSRYLNGGRIRTAERVQAAIDQLSFRPNVAAQSLKSGKTYTLVLVGSDATNPLISHALRAIQSALQSSPYRIFFYPSEAGMEQRVVSDTVGKVDGVILSPHGPSDPTADLLREAGLPVVLLYGDVGARGRFDLSDADNYGGARLAVDYLVKLGHTKISAITARHMTLPAEQRALGFSDAMLEHGLDVLDEYERDDGYSLQSVRQAGYTAMLRLLTLPSPPTAVFSAGALLTVGALHAMKDVGISMPEDLSLISFDDHELFDIFPPGITVVARAVDQQASRALTMLLQRLDGSFDGPPRIEQQGSELIARGSCAAI